MRLAFTAALLALAWPVEARAQDLIGHGGPVGALSVQGGAVLSGAFDTRAILWSSQGQAAAVLRIHDGAVTAVAQLSDGRLATGGQDGRIALWPAGGGVEPLQLTAPYPAPVVALSHGPGGLLAAHRDGWLRGLDTATAGFQAHRDRISGLAHMPDGSFVTVGGDLALRRWEGARLVASADLPALPNGLAVQGDRLALVFADGALRLYDAEGRLLPERFLTDRPLVAVAAGPDHLAAASVDGTVWLLDAARVEAVHRLAPGQGPVWALALDSAQLFTAGGDGRILRWRLSDGARLGAGDGAVSGTEAWAEFWDDGSRGAQVWRACAACHTLTPDDGNRAGPSLHNIFGRRIGTVPGFDYSDSLPQLDIIWTPETVAALFEHGPEAYTPGSRMPEQRLSDPADRAALVEFLARFSD